MKKLLILLTILFFPLSAALGRSFQQADQPTQVTPEQSQTAKPNLESKTGQGRINNLTPKPSPEAEKTHAFVIGSHRLIITESPRNNLFGEGEATTSASLVSPYPVVVDIGEENKQVNSFIVSYLNKDNQIIDEKWIPTIKSTVQANFDSDSAEEVLVEWVIPTGVSDMSKVVTVFDLQNDKLIPLSFIPDNAYPDGAALVYQQTGNKLSFRNFDTMHSFRTEYLDLNKDGITEMLFYWYDWREDESHYEAHYWNLHVLEMNNGEPVEPLWWNEGIHYETEEKLGFDQQSREVILNYYRKFVNKKAE